MRALRGPAGAAASAACLALALIALALPGSARSAPVPWCGSGEPTTDLPDAVSAFEWHAIYAIPQGGQDRFAYFAPRIAGDIETMSNWWLGQDSTRKPRFDLLNAPGCPDEYARVDISVVHLPHANGEETFDQIETDLIAAGFDSPDKAYLVYFDGSLHVGDEYGICGEGATADDAWAYGVVYLQTCDQESSDATRAMVATHELVHGLGAVVPDAPHYCNDGHVCDSSSDLMKAVFGDGDSLASLQLDVGRDDYYGHSGSWWDTQDSGLLYHLDLSLPPTPPVIATATNVGSVVQVNWFPQPFADNLFYRIYDTSGQLLQGVDQDMNSTNLTTTGSVGQTLTWTIRAEDDGGSLGPATTLRFKVGYGTVDANGKLLRDTVRPAPVSRVRASRVGSQVLLQWPKVADPIGLRGYRVTAPGLAQLTVKTTSVRVAFAAVRGKTVTVRAVDEAGNAGLPATTHVSR